MQIDVSFETFKALTALRQYETDSVGDVIDRLIGQSPNISVKPIGSAKGLFAGGVLFPNGTQFRARYKGEPHLASVIDGNWVDSEGVSRNSPFDAASAISNTNVNGWRFWEARFPTSTEWTLLDRLRG